MSECKELAKQARFWRRTPPALTRQDVADIREMRGRKASIQSIAARYRVSKDTIRDAIYGDGAYRGM